jgi:hypothetical protein
MFSPLEERSIVFFIQADFIEPDRIFTDSDFREIAINAACNRMRTLMRLLRRFNARTDSSFPSKQVIVCLRRRFMRNAGQL